MGLVIFWPPPLVESYLVAPRSVVIPSCEHESIRRRAPADRVIGDSVSSSRNKIAAVSASVCFVLVRFH